ncbi:19033_t:CDS:1 [Cetraspora pellucida]|uniref:19033_t:CDS:1 n=1 Tax=Cetraspora pellucida TaxID=1433469 RepID=A0A9N8ZH86_9GLOM|nr:19033_t:CDS:1 [Cetraspora pellucida]
MQHIKYMPYVLCICIFFSLTFLSIISNEAYHFINLKDTENTTITKNDTVNAVKEHTTIRHLEFDKVFNKYVEKHNKIIDKLLKPSNESNLLELPKVIVAQPDMNTGYGNRLVGVVCGFLYSLITDRLFFIDGYSNFENYYEKDFEHDWKIIEYLYQNSSSRYLHDNNDYNDFPLVARGNLSDEKTDILYVHTWDYSCAPIMSNPHYKNWFDKIIPDYNVFSAVSLKLLRLHPQISQKVETFANNNFNDHIIGIHYREKKSPHDMVIPIEHYVNVVRMLLVEAQNTNVTLFVAADNNNGLKKLVDSLHEAINSNSNDSSVKIFHSQDDLDAKNSVSWNTGTEVGALIDIKLLSLCDDLVITYGSSFGFLAAAWSEKASRRRGPFIVMPIKNSIEDLLAADKVWVWGASTSEPCMYLSKWLMNNEDKETVKAFKTNPLWMHYSQCHWPHNY